MIKINTSLELADRLDFPASSQVLDSGRSGSLATLDGDGELILASGTTGLCFPIFSESNRDGSAGFTPDVHRISQVTVFRGRIQYVTDQYDNTSIDEHTAIGKDLVGGATNKAGVLVARTSEDASLVIARLVKGPTTMIYLGRSVTVIEVLTV